MLLSVVPSLLAAVQPWVCLFLSPASLHLDWLVLEKLHFAECSVELSGSVECSVECHSWQGPRCLMTQVRDAPVLALKMISQEPRLHISLANNSRLLWERKLLQVV